MSPLPTPLKPAFFNRPTLTVARDLLGARLIRLAPALSAAPIVCEVVETEAYTADDPACHAYNRPAKGRAAMLYATPGTAYVYFIYGMYHCLNVVTEPEGVAGAVLFRAVAIETPAELAEPKAANGPGKLCRALAITTAEHNGTPMTAEAGGLWLAKGREVAEPEVIMTTRIGISKGVELPWRFYIKGHPAVSRR